MNKKQLRTKIQNQRKQKSKQFILTNSEQIRKQLMKQSLFQHTSKILFYVSYNGEVHTHDLIKKSFSLNKTIYVPISNPQTHTLYISKLDQFTDLSPGTYGILEPKKDTINTVPLNQIELIIVPGVAFDEHGHRIGQGGGYYDWLLSKTRVPTIALAFEFQIHATIPIEPHDQRIDYIITEKRVISCF